MIRFLPLTNILQHKEMIGFLRLTNIVWRLLLTCDSSRLSNQIFKLESQTRKLTSYTLVKSRIEGQNQNLHVKTSLEVCLHFKTEL